MKKNNLSRGKSRKGISIRSKIIFAILVPVIFIIFLGYSSYQKASKALFQSYEFQTESTVQLTSEYYDLLFSDLENTAYEIGVTDCVSDYLSGVYSFDPLKLVKFRSAIQTQIFNIDYSNDFISRILLVTTEDLNSVDSLSRSIDKKAYNLIAESSLGNDLTNKSYKWVGYRNEIDESIKSSSEDYAMSLVRIIYNLRFQPAAYEMIELDYKQIKEILASTKLSEGSIIGLITPDGRELSAKIPKEGEDAASLLGDSFFQDQDFLHQAFDSEEAQFSDYVDYNGESYFMASAKLNHEGFLVVALIPKSFITSQALPILNSTMAVVLISCLVAILIGSLVARNFSKSIKSMRDGLALASKGDLTVEIKSKANDEFKTLAESINNMIVNVRNLLFKANSVTEVVDAASEEVNSNADTMLDSTEEIKNSISEIDAGIVGQAEDAEKCLQQMDALSEKINMVTNSTENISSISNLTRSTVSKGIVTIDELKAKSEDTKRATASVISSIEELNESSASIEQIIGVINTIAGQTSLLSLNASIEAARAGDYGRGFSVVADEIRKLAEQSKDSVMKIQKIVENIQLQTEKTVDVAKHSSEIVESQEEALLNTVNVFYEIDSQVAGLTEDLDSILTQIQAINDAKKETLSAIESISAISEETAAVTSTVQSSAEAQLEAARSLALAAKSLRTDSEDLSSSIHLFTI